MGPMIVAVRGYDCAALGTQGWSGLDMRGPRDEDF
jgi:hypothetical protein